MGMVEVRGLRLCISVLFVAMAVSAMAQQKESNDFAARRAIEKFYNLNKERIEANYKNLFPNSISLEESEEDTDRWMQEYSGNVSSIDDIGEEYLNNLEYSIKEYFINRANFAVSRQKSINKVSANELRRLLFLTEYQICNFIAYRSKNGLILSVQELSSVKGFNDYIACFCAVLFGFPNEDANPYNTVLAAVEEYNNDRNSCFETKLRYSPQKYMRLRQKVTCSFKSGAHISAGVFCENDAGEGGNYFWRLWSGQTKKQAKNMAYDEAAGDLQHKIPIADFTSFNISADNICFKGLKLGFAAGDFRAGFGYGLVVRQGLNFTSYMQPISFVSNNNRIMPYSGSDENDYFRGIAIYASAPKQNISFSVFYSDKAIDARSNGNGYSSILKEGRHNTPSLFATRKTLGETVCGANISKEYNMARIGVTAVARGLNLPYTGKLNYYNGYRHYTRSVCNFGFNWLYLFGSAMIFGEAAYCAKIGNEEAVKGFDTPESERFAALCGAYLRIGDDIELMLGLRYYGVSYIAPFAGAYSTVGDLYNQRGAFVSFFKPVSGSLRLGLFADYTLYPFPRYRLPYKTSSFKIMTGLENYANGFGFNWNIRGVLSSTPFNTKLYMKGMGRYKLGSLAVTGRGEAGVGYGAAQLGTDYLSNNKGLKVSAGVMCYSINDWENRIYMYEATLPGTYGSRLLYKKGFAGYLYLMARPFKWCKFYFKYSAPNGYVMFGTDLCTH